MNDNMYRDSNEVALLVYERFKINGYMYFEKYLKWKNRNNNIN